MAHYTTFAAGLPYGIIDPDYARVYTQARIIAWQYGYACVMHGSFTRDLDLLLVPWAGHAGPNHDQLLKLIAQACGLRFRDGEEDIYKSKADWTDKPHGRKACSLFFPQFGDQRWVDISIIPTPNGAIREVMEEVRQLCRDYSSRDGNVYILDVLSALDAVEQRVIESTTKGNNGRQPV
jgi:hypothetical protein